MQFVLLTDSDNATMLIACPDDATAQEVAGAAVFSDGGVSAWLVPERAVYVGASWYSIVDKLREGWDITNLHDFVNGDTQPVKLKLKGGTP